MDQQTMNKIVMSYPGYYTAASYVADIWSSDPEINERVEMKTFIDQIMFLNVKRTEGMSLN